MADILPTIADLVGFEIPADYAINGESLVPFLFTDRKEHRDWIYAYRGPEQLVRGRKVLKDGRDQWWDVSAEPADLTSYPAIRNWDSVLEIHRQEREMLLELLPEFDLYFDEYNAPGVAGQPERKRPGDFRKKKGN